MKPSFLFISNGYGEDTIAAHIGKRMLDIRLSQTIKAFPTVGSGKYYSTIGISLAGEGICLPSEGFVRSLKDFLKDLRHGFIQKNCRLGHTLGKVSKPFDFLIIVGDPYLLLYTSFFTKHPPQRRVFIGVQQSEWYGSRKPFKQHYSFIERRWMKHLAGLIYVRDEKTMDFLRSKGLNHVHCEGNPMMDCFSISKQKVLSHNRRLIGILPGSKQESYENMTVIFNTIKNLSLMGGHFNYAIALSPQLDESIVVTRFGLRFRYSRRRDGKHLYTSYELPGTVGEIFISKHLFGDIINESIAVIGVSGTGNEQAAGLGKPVFGFWGKGPQITEKFMKAQKKLLGKSLILLPPEPGRIAATIIQTLSDKFLLKEIEENGKIRMCGRGSIERIVSGIESYIKRVMRNNL
ncbi:MAG: lipid-A-disaccharide synthase-related protein [Spirochaetota bacterium]